MKCQISMHIGIGKLGTIRWLVRVSHHIARITFHIEKAVLRTGK